MNVMATFTLKPNLSINFRGKNNRLYTSPAGRKICETSEMLVYPDCLFIYILKGTQEDILSFQITKPKEITVKLAINWQECK